MANTNIVKGELKNGFKYEIDLDNFLDLDVLEQIDEIEDDDMLGAFKTLKIVMGEKLYKQAKAYLKDTEGKATVVNLESLLNEIMEDAKEKSELLKND